MENMRFITARKRSLGQGNILHLFVILFTEGLGLWVPGPGRMPGLGGPGLGDAWSRGVPGPRAVPGQRGAWWRPPPPLPGMATAAGGTHPIGMHSCLKIISLWSIQIVRTVFKPVKLIFS